MLKRVFLFLLLLVLFSCATISNKRMYPLKVISFEENQKAVINDSIYQLPAEVWLMRSDNDLEITIIAEDSLTKKVTAKALPSPQYVYGNLIFGLFCPAGYYIDSKSPKRYYYGNRLFADINAADTILKPSFVKSVKYYFSKKYYYDKGNWAATVSIPYMNGFYQQPKGLGSKRGFGFFGLSAGIDYCYKDNHSIRANASIATDFPVPVPAPLDRFDAYETIRAVNFTLSHNHFFNRLQFGYGFNYAVNTWCYIPNRTSFIQQERIYRRKSSYSLGLTTNTYLRLSEDFKAGVVYNPTIYNILPNTNLFGYQHCISLDIAYVLPLKDN